MNDDRPPKLDVGTLADLSQRNITARRNFNEWLEIWQKATHLSDMLGLLHELKNVDFDSSWNEPKYTSTDREIFLLKVSEGWYDTELLRTKGDISQKHIGSDKYGNTLYATNADIRQKVAQKAFAILCQEFFKLGVPDEETYGKLPNPRFFSSIILDTNLFLAINHFFRLGERGFSLSRYEIPNLPKRRPSSETPQLNHPATIARSFLMNLIDNIWGLETEHHERSYFSEKALVTVINNIDEAKPWTIEVLNYFDELKRIRRYSKDLDESSLDKLRAIAMRSTLTTLHHPIEKDRLVESLEEAIYAGSAAGLFLFECETKVKIAKRLEAIRKAREIAERAKARLDSLTKGS